MEKSDETVEVVDDGVKEVELKGVPGCAFSNCDYEATSVSENGINADTSGGYELVRDSSRWGRR